MLEADFYGKLLPTHLDIMALVQDIRTNAPPRPSPNIRKSAGVFREGACNAKVM
jgi:hypothetical protein